MYAWGFDYKFSNHNFGKKTCCCIKTLARELNSRVVLEIQCCFNSSTTTTTTTNNNNNNNIMMTVFSWKSFGKSASIGAIW